ncbi:bifunctional DNA-formamidopyrimidine glycosylase/DNA-(apurinic or apyrimidinic site) lyase [Mesoplasma corruscae]|uniref:Formamidopyrimidine-DNA glycosylase n=1 Tax=Mesoplasma corruscae TaxID=216874 RepID=A0A2S5RHJ0_9MOLU|nr:bifunctional DNA-formamidopyrimidine glycosylase/DNA-(apurinic or apyrimidinic site) lyase [Mesoplasma corruscae]PPE06758.1 formamidopyrimidine-DNA glycosylase [Mesoplasma corruscae]
MPELPEVRTVANELNKILPGLRIINGENFMPKLIWRNKENDFFDKVLDQKIISVQNYGKYLIFNLENFKMISHLRMEGKWSVSSKDKYVYNEKHLRIEFELSNNEWLRYYDSRKFGTLEVWDNKSYLKESGISNLGPEPLNNNPSFEYLKKAAIKKNVKVKPFLLDQKVVCGIGNIYVNEILFAAKVAPDRITKTLGDKEIKNIIKFSNLILTKAIELKGSSIHSYKSGENVEGQFQNELKVHLRENKPCFECKKPIIKTQIGGRGTYFCTECQK